MSQCSGEGCNHPSHQAQGQRDPFHGLEPGPVVVDEWGPSVVHGVTARLDNILADRKLLFKLNHEERRAWKARFKALPERLRRTQVINLNAKIYATDGDGTLIKGEGDTFLDLRHVVLTSLKAGLQSDAQAPLKVKQERYDLLKRIQGNLVMTAEGAPALNAAGKAQFDGAPNEIELTQAERNSILERAAKIYVQVEILGRVQELLEGAA